MAEKGCIVRKHVRRQKSAIFLAVVLLLCKNIEDLWKKFINRQYTKGAIYFILFIIIKEVFGSNTKRA